jgi:hypothetical protein
MLLSGWHTNMGFLPVPEISLQRFLVMHGNVEGGPPNGCHILFSGECA